MSISSFFPFLTRSSNNGGARYISIILRSSSGLVTIRRHIQRNIRKHSMASKSHPTAQRNDTAVSTDGENGIINRALPTSEVNDDEGNGIEKPTLPIPLVDESGQPISKNKWKKLRRDREWEAHRAVRKAKRKEKDAEKKARKREEKTKATAGTTSTLDAASVIDPVSSTTTDHGRRDSDATEVSPSAAKKARLASDQHSANITNGHSSLDPPLRRQRPCHTLLPVTILIDCGFDALMTETEVKSVGSQVTRCYSDCHRASFQARLVVTGFGGRLKERFEGPLEGNHLGWKGVRFSEEGWFDLVSRERRTEEDLKGAVLGGAFQKFADPSSLGGGEREERESLTEQAEIVYLTSESENTLLELKPYSTYIIGGIVDRNRHKGICYKRAVERGVKTAKLPIKEYMQMQSRSVLATNHVVEIMLRWLECGDWGDSFVKVMPKRKGGRLRLGDTGSGSGVCGNGAADKAEECERAVKNEEDEVVAPREAAEKEQQEEEEVKEGKRETEVDGGPPDPEHDAQTPASGG